MNRMMKLLIVFSLPIFSLWAGCSDSDGEPTSGAGAAGGGGAGGAGGSGAGGSGGMILEDGWNEIKPGGATTCARGDEFAYFVHPGTVNKVVVDFIGGGACWDDFTCSVADAIFNDSVDPIREAIAEDKFLGIYDRQNPDNPFKDWTHVVIPYCTGDIHWGDATTTYGEGDSAITIEHHGATNARVVLDWVYENYQAPEQVFVTGCSAGSYGSALWAAHIMDHYPDSQVLQFGDCGAGVITADFFENSFPSWNAEQAFPNWIDALDPSKVDLFSLDLSDLYIGIADQYPANHMAQYNTMFDENQHFFYQAMGGGDVEEWSAQMTSSIERIEANAPNFAAFLAPGEQHCIILYDNFYTVNAGGVKLTDWLNDYLEDGKVDSAKCVDCAGPTP